MAITLVLISVAIALVIMLHFKIKRHMRYWKYQGIPHDEPNLLTGNMHGIFRTRNFYDMYKETYGKFRGSGPFAGYYFFQRLGVVLLDLDVIKQVLIKDFANFADRGLFHNDVDDPLTGHLFALDGQKWRKMRAKLTPTFTSGKMKFMFPTIIEVVQQFVNVFGQMVEGSETVEIRELLARFTTDVIGTCAFGIDCQSLQDPESEFRVMGRRSISDSRHHRLLVGFMNAKPDWARKLHMKTIPDDITEFFLRIVRDTVDYRLKNNVQRNDFLSILMELNKDKTTGDSLKLTIEEMAAQAFVFFLGGFETSSITMAFALYELALHPEIQNELRREIQGVFRKYNNTMSYESMKELTYMEQVISETLRKYSVVPQVNRNAKADYPIPGHPKYVIRKGMRVIVPIVGVHHDPDIYPNPEEFDPDRFSPENVQQRDAAAFLGFGVGPRACIGMRFGQMQIRIGLAYLLNTFKFSPCKDTEIPVILQKSHVLTCPKNGIRLKVEKI